MSRYPASSVTSTPVIRPSPGSPPGTRSPSPRCSSPAGGSVTSTAAGGCSSPAWRVSPSRRCCAVSRRVPRC
ncbi:hypothetical protein NKH77_04150 [Streptomyces sp. M19]